ncbi:hypothetical protein [Albibacterium sp.]|uniref:hypothetical protein n=1 Tax=Albibacterium sp. TaxID=2952885 RepID=UPI002B82575E|nr:hypothetical protein [Albibacterium sp.]HUH18726.1 hypothetical protein [Albibacterium sp.]
MKRNYITGTFISILFLITFSVQAQVSTNVSINLTDVISVDPNSSIHADPVRFQYKNEGDYNKSQTIVRNSYLIVTATQSYDIKVKADGPNFIGEGTAAGSTIPVNVLTVDASDNTSDLPGAVISVINLSTEDQNIVTGAEKGNEQQLTIKYIIPQAKSQSPDILGKPSGNYIQKLTYSVIAH